MIPPSETIVETKICRISGQEFPIFSGDLEFYDKISPAFGGKKCLIPTPTLCPNERMRRRLSFRNERNLYKDTCALTGESIVSVYHPGHDFPVYKKQLWYSDAWDPHEYGRDFDFDRSFFDQFGEMYRIIPKPNVNVDNLQNSDFCNNCGNLKNCYLSFEGDNSERVFHTSEFNSCTDVVDCLKALECEKCYECVTCLRCYECFYSQDLQNSQSCYFCNSCLQCKNCFGCVGLNHREYCFLNEQLTREDYHERLTEVLANMSSWFVKIQNKLTELKKQFPRKNYIGNVIENSYGDELYNCKNTFASFSLQTVENVRYTNNMELGKDFYDCSAFGINASSCYECQQVGLDSNTLLFCNSVWLNMSNMHYCILNISNASNCFGCMGMRNGANHNVLNKPYSKHEYGVFCGKVVDHMVSTKEWGEFFPTELSPFGYNETMAQVFLPLERKEVLQRGWSWYDEPEVVVPSPVYTQKPIQQYDENVVGKDAAQDNISACLARTFVCEATGKPFKIIAQELAFYIENKLPLPSLHPNERYARRCALRNPRHLWNRTCDHCQTDIVTAYGPSGPERVYCEDCYLKEAY